MDIFKFNNPTSDTLMEQGKIINDLNSKMWIERYREGGAFELTGYVSSGLRTELPIGSFVSHTDTTEIMIVENHEISEEKGEEPEITITGRGFETYFENRIVGSNKTFPTQTGPETYTLVSDMLRDQAIKLVEDHILAVNLIDDDNAIPYVTVMTTATSGSFVPERIVKRGDLYKRLLELLELEDLGIKVVRPGVWSPLGVGNANTAVVIHEGVDRSDEVVFSYDTGEIERADYLWSNKKYKNCAMVTGKWIEVFVDTPEAGYDRRMMFIEAGDIDELFDAEPTEPALTPFRNLIRQRGEEVLAAQKFLSISKAEVSKNATKAVYRKDFDVGDYITVNGNYEATSKMRVNEYVEIEDSNGKSAYPTLTKV